MIGQVSKQRAGMNVSVSFLTSSQTGLPSKEHKSVRGIKEAMDTERPTLIGFFKDDQDPVYKTYIEVRAQSSVLT